MASKKARARSSASIKSTSRPLSAQSTQSTDSNATQPMSNGYGGYGQMPFGEHGHEGNEGQETYHSHLGTQNGQEGHGLEASQRHIPLEEHLLNLRQPLSTLHPGLQNQLTWSNTLNLPDNLPHGVLEQMGGYPSHDPTNLPRHNFNYRAMSSTVPVGPSEVDNETAVASDTGTGRPKKKGSATSQANDMELRRLFREHQRRDLSEVAKEVMMEDKGPRAEKSKQIFGMLWLSRNIKRSTGSVPRNRVYACYATRCGDDHLKLLNPASFGKLVRILFPNIQTRRLGVRGESKYHYVNLSLENDDGHEPVLSKSNGSVKKGTAKTRQFSIQPRTSTIASPEGAYDHSANYSANTTLQVPLTGHKRASSAFLQGTIEVQAAAAPSKRLKTIPRYLRWPEVVHTVSDDDQLKLPNMEQYMPAGTDCDAAANLHAIYSSHCRLVERDFRYCQTDAIIESYKTLTGLLTVPSQKLMAEKKMAEWIEACDTLKFRRMTPLLWNIATSLFPAKALSHMERVADGLCEWIQKYFGHQPPHLLDAMLRPARAFTKIITRFIRVNQCARNLGEIFKDQEARDELWVAWVKGSDPVSIVEDVCDPAKGGHNRLLYMLFRESRILVQPSQAATDKVGRSMFDEELWIDREPRAAYAFRLQESERDPKEGFTQRLCRFIESIPNRYPGVEAGEVLAYVNGIAGAVARNFAHKSNAYGGLDESKGSVYWRSISNFTSELLIWMAEVGGYLPTAAETAAEAQVEEEQIPGQTETGKAASSEISSDSSSRKESEFTSAENSYSQSTDAQETNGSQKPRISLGGATMVGDDEELDFDQNIDWGSA